MARLPVPGSDEGNWGDILNDYLSQAHKADGSLKDNIVSESSLAPTVVTKLNAIAGQQGATGATGPAGATGPQGPGGSTDLSVTSDATTVTITSSTGNDAILTAATTSSAGILSATDKTALDGVQGQLDQRPVYVFVTSGTETRPSATHVIWVGGTTRPTNSLAGDLWLSETP